MVDNLLSTLLLLFSSFITVILIYYKLPVNFIQQIIALLILLTVIALNKSLFAQSQSAKLSYLRWFLFFTSILMVQLIVISSGGILSPFFILFHLSTLALSIFLSSFIAISFVVFSVITIGATTYFNPTIMALVKGDLGTVVLILSSLITIVPITQVISRTYHIKDNISKLLEKQLNLKQAIINDIDELVFTTDLNLNILSVNETAERILNTSTKEVSGKHLLSILDLKNENKQPISVGDLSISNIVLEKTTRIIQRLLLKLPDKNTPLSVSLRVKPVLDIKGLVNQLVIVVSTEQSGSSLHDNLNEARQKFEQLSEDFEKSLVSAPTRIKTRALFLTKIEKDLNLAMEIEDHPIKPENTLVDVAELCWDIVDKMHNFAQILGVNLIFQLDDIAEKSLLSLKRSTTVNVPLNPSSFSAVTDVKWLKVLVEKLLDIAILLSMGNKDTQVIVLPVQSNNEIKISISSSYPELSAIDKNDLFLEYFGSLGNTNLKYGSGLEGFLVKTISAYLNIPVEITAKDHPSHLVFEIPFTKSI